MKPILLFPLLGVLLLLVGCESQSLTLEKHGQELAPALGAEVAELAFLSECQFQLVEAGKSASNRPQRGVLAMSDSHFYLVTAAADRSQQSYKITIPIQDMEGISKLPSQFHLKYQGEVMVFWLREADSKADTQEKYATVYTLFENRNVVEMASTQEYQRPMYSWDRNNDAPHGGSYYIPGVRLSSAYGAVRNSNTRGTQVTGIR